MHFYTWTGAFSWPPRLLGWESDHLPRFLHPCLPQSSVDSCCEPNGHLPMEDAKFHLPISIIIAETHKPPLTTFITSPWIQLNFATHPLTKHCDCPAPFKGQYYNQITPQSNPQLPLVIAEIPTHNITKAKLMMHNPRVKEFCKL